MLYSASGKSLSASAVATSEYLAGSQYRLLRSSYSGGRSTLRERHTGYRARASGKSLHSRPTAHSGVDAGGRYLQLIGNLDGHGRVHGVEVSSVMSGHPAPSRVMGHCRQTPRIAACSSPSDPIANLPGSRRAKHSSARRCYVRGSQEQWALTA
jgi:hypothetical protein